MSKKPVAKSEDQTQLKASEVKYYREEALERDNICPLCETPILPEEATLDHCHDTGFVRRVLHRSCNSAEGRILQFAGKRSRGDDPVLFVQNVLKYWEGDYTSNPLHPTFGKPKRKRRRRSSGKSTAKRVKRKNTPMKATTKSKIRKKRHVRK